MSIKEDINPAEAAAQRAWEELHHCLNKGANFVFEAGAGAGKTYSLIAALKSLLSKRSREFTRYNQQVACITFTKVARDNILEQIDDHPAVFCETIHAFAWALISPFQKKLCELVQELPSWNAFFEDEQSKNLSSVEYALGHRSLQENKALLHHDDVFPLFITLLSSEKFRFSLASRFPVILVDEYQDTDANLVEALVNHSVGKVDSPQYGFFGDHWQKIYGTGCGSIQHESLRRIGKNANFRSAKAIVDCLNRMRPELPQEIPNSDFLGSVEIFHTNGWNGARQTRNHWQGDLQDDAAASAFEYVRTILQEQRGWDLNNDTKILMLTHRALAAKMGYPSLPATFRYNDSFTRKANDFIAFFDEHLEPAVSAFQSKKYGLMFELIDTRRPLIESHLDKVKWAFVMQQVCELRSRATVGDLLDYLENCGLSILSEKVLQLSHELRTDLMSGQELTRSQAELQNLRNVPYLEIVHLCEYLKGHSIFETQHGVKGEQFENVLVVFGRGWNEYDFNAFLEMSRVPPRDGASRAIYERYRNLFYVAVSRPKKNLALLFTQKLSAQALEQLHGWFTGNPITDIGRFIDSA